jgi:hypothetical protein
MVDYIIKNFPQIGIGILMVAFGSWVAYFRWNKTRKISAADKFHEAINIAIKKVHPDSCSWPINVHHLLINTIDPIETAVIKFKRFSSRHTDLDKALKNYKDCCESTDFNKVAAFCLYDESRKEDEISPEDTFRKVVNDLLKLAEKP